MKTMWVKVVLLIVSFSAPIYAQFNWEELKLPYGGAVYSLCQDKQENIYACTSSGLYKSTNEGNTWVNIYREVLFNETCKFYVHSSGVIFCMGRYNEAIKINSDESVTKIAENLYLNYFFEDKNGEIYSSSALSNFIYVSADTGKTWRKKFELNENFDSFFMSSSGKIFLTNYNGLYSSNDSGKTWVANHLDGLFRSKMIETKNGKLLLFGEYKFYSSVDNGITWQNYQVPFSYSSEVFQTSSGDFYISSQYDGVFKSSDYGNSWTSFGRPETCFSDNTVLLTKKNNLLAGSQSIGVSRYDFVYGKWKESNFGIEANLSGLNLTPLNNLIISTGSKLWRSSDKGSSWQLLYTNSCFINGVKRISNKLYFYSSSNVLFESTDDGVTWSESNEKVYFNRLPVLGKDNNYFVVYSEKVYRSTDGCLTWNVVWQKEESDKNTQDYLTQFTVTPNGEICFFYGADFYISYDSGENWIITSPAEKRWQEYHDTVYYIKLSTLKDGSIFITLFDKIYKLSIHNTWELIATLHENLGIASYYIMDFDVDINGNCYLISNNELWFAPYPGIDWSFKAILPLSLCTNLNICSDGFYITDGNKLFFSKYEFPKVKEKIVDKLSNPYPNPFNGQTIIEFYLSSPDNIKIEIFNSLGEKIETIAENYITAGFFRVRWAPKNISSGIYYYRLTSSTFTESKKMIYLK